MNECKKEKERKKEDEDEERGRKKKKVEEEEEEKEEDRTGEGGKEERKGEEVYESKIYVFESKTVSGHNIMFLKVRMFLDITLCF